MNDDPVDRGRPATTGPEDNSEYQEMLPSSPAVIGCEVRE